MLRGSPRQTLLQKLLENRKQRQSPQGKSGKRQSLRRSPKLRLSCPQRSSLLRRKPRRKRRSLRTTFKNYPSPTSPEAPWCSGQSYSPLEAVTSVRTAFRFENPGGATFLFLILLCKRLTDRTHPNNCASSRFTSRMMLPEIWAALQSTTVFSFAPGAFMVTCTSFWKATLFTLLQNVRSPGWRICLSHSGACSRPGG